MLPEKKVFSQHGEDGIIEFLHSTLKHRDYKFIEIGCASGDECNSRYLLEKGWTGICIDADSGKVERYRMRRLPATFIGQAITAKSLPKLSEVFYSEPDVFSLDIDSYDYFIADWLFRNGFRPRIICVETNTFLRGPVTVKYLESFSRYALQPGYGLYFGAGEEAWKHLFKDYHYCGMDSSFTNAFFVRDSDYSVPAEPSGYQTYFCQKYGKPGEKLSELVMKHPMLDVTSSEYEQAYKAVFA